MKRRTVLLYIAPAIALAITLLGVLPLQGIKPDWKLQSEPLHSTVEAIGALAGMLMALLLIVRQEDANSKSFLLGLGFLGMGLLDSFHAISVPGSGFVLLHSTAVLVGGMGFALVWLPKLGLYSVRSDRHFKRFAPWLLAAGSVGFSAMVLLYRDAFPAMTANGVFTSAAVAINVSAGLLYLLGALHFFLEYRRYGNTEFYLFYIVSLLFGFSGLTFMYSQLWSDEWWVWHFVRLAAFIAILGFLAVRHQSNASELARLNRVYAVLSRTNGAMVRIRDPQKLYEETCRIAVEDGRFGMAWAGLLAQGANAVTPVAQYGTDGKGVPVEDLQRGRGPVSTAVREERQIICNDIEHDPWMRPWRDEALGRGYRSLAAFPLRAGGKVIGALAFYAMEPNFFSNGEVRLLEELASDVSFATEYKEQEERRRQADTASLYVRGLIEASLDPLVTISPAGKITDVNNATEQVTGIQRAKLIGSDFSDYFTEPEKAREGYRQVFSRGFVRDYPLSIRHTSGRVTDVLYNATLYRDEAGKVIGIFAAARDITERKKAEEQIRAASLYARSLIEASLDPLVTISPEGKITDVNNATEQATGVPRSSLIGTDFSKYFTEPGEAQKGYMQVFRRGFVRDYPLAIRHKSGKITDVLYNATIYKDEAGNVKGVFAAARDITERKKTEAQLHAASLYARSLIEASLDPLVTISPDGKITDVNNATEQVTGVSRDRLIGSDFSDYFTEPDEARKGYKQVFEKGFVKDYPLSIRHRSGKVTDVLYNATVYKSEAGKVIGVFAAARDITERKRAEEKLLQSASIIEFSDDAIIAKGLDGTITGWNPGAEKMYGYPAGEAIGRNIALIAPPDRKDEIPEILKRIRKGEYIEHYETVRVRKDGKRIDVSITISPIKDKEGNIIGASAIGRDITEKKQAEERLQESEKKFRNLVESVPIGIAISTPKGEIIEVNTTVLEIFGYTREEFEKLQASALYYDPKARERFVEELLKKGKVADFEAEFKRKDGSVFWGSITTTAQKTASGKTQFLNAFLDITERKRAEDEIKKLNVELEAFSYSVSHDLRAPLRSIDGFSQALLEDCGKKVDEQGREDISRVRAATAKMAELIDAMLVLSRVTRREMRSEAVDLSGIARAVANELKASEPSRKAEFVIADGITVKGDPDMLQAVLQNLMENSWKFTSKHRKAIIEFGAVQKDGRPAYFVRDDGAGFDPQYSDKLFKAFQRLHSTTDFPGIGIGLATVQRIIGRHGGKIWAEGAVEKGATFYFTL